MANQINFQLTTSTDLKGVRELKKELQDIRNLTTEASLGNNFLAGETEQIQKIINDVDTLEYALENAFNPKINAINIEKFNKTLKESNTDIAKLSHTLLSLGANGQKAFLSLNNSLMQMGTATKQTNKFLNEMAITFKNSVKWGLSSAVWNNMVGGAEQAYGYVKKLDSSLNDIRIVTGKSAEEMKKFAESANNAAKELGTATTDYTKGSTIYYQQGLDDKTTATLTEVTAKASNVTGQSMEEVSEQLTAVWNGYKVSNEAAEKGMGVYEEYVDKMAAVGAATASDLEELATAMSKVASGASMMGVDFDQLNAQIATIVSVTRQAPESVGTALKTIYARMGDLKLGGTDEDGLGLGEVSGTLESVGIQMLDAKGDLRDMGDIIEDVAAKWDTLSRGEQDALAQVMAGKRQYNNLLALFDNWDMYANTLDVAKNAAGTLQEQQDIYLDSTNAKLETLNATFEDLFDSLLDTDDINGFIEGLTTVVQLFADLADSLGGLHNILPMIGAIGLRTFKDQIGKGIQESVTNSKNLNTELEVQRKNKEILKKGNIASKEDEDKLPSIAKERLEEGRKLYDEIQGLNITLTAEQKEQINNIINANTELAKMSINYEDQIADLKSSSEYFKILNDNLEEQELTSENINKLLEERHQITSDLVQASKKISESSEINEIKFKATNKNIKALKNKSATNVGSYEEAFVGNYNKRQSRNKVGNFEKEVLNSEDNKELDKINNDIEKYLKSIKKAGGDITNLEQHFKDLKSIVKEVNENTEKFANGLGKAGVKKDLIKSLTQNFRELSIEGKDISEIFDILAKELEKAGMESAELEGVLREISNEAPRVADSTKGIKEGLEFEDAVANIVDVGGALFGLYESFSMIQNLGSIWSDDDLSIGQQIEQTIGNLIIVIPQLVSAYKVLTNQKKIDNAIELLSQSFTKIKIALETKYLALKKKMPGILTKEITLKGAHIAATEGEVVATEAATGAQIGLNTAMNANPIGVIIIAITALIAVLGALSAAYNKAQESAIKDADSDIEEYNKISEALYKQKEALDELSNSMANLSEQYRQGKIILNDYKKEVIKSYEEMAKAAEDDGRFDEAERYRIAAKRAKTAENEKDLQNTQDAITHDNNLDIYYNNLDLIDAEKRKASTQMKKDAGFWNTTTGTSLKNNVLANSVPGIGLAVNAINEASLKKKVDDKGLDKSNLIELEGIRDSSDDAALKALEGLGVGTVANGLDTFIDTNSLIEAYAKNTEEIDRVINNMAGAEGESIRKYLDANADLIQELKDNISENERILKENASYELKEEGIIKGRDKEGQTKDIDINKDINSLKEFNTAADQLARQKFFDEGNEMGFESMAEALDWARNSLGGINDELAEFESKENAIQTLLTGHEDDEGYEEKVRQYTENLDSDEIAYIPLGFDFNDASEEELNTVIAEAQRKAQEQRVEVGISLGTDAVNKLLSGEQIDESTAKALEQQYSQIKGLEEESEQLAAIRDKNSRAYLDKILEINQKLEQLRTNNAVEDFNEVLGNIDVKADTDVFMEQMDALTEADYEVSVAVKADMDSDFDQISGILDNIEDYSGKIGENFIVAAKDVEELNDAFPGILDQCEYLADGTIQLNQAVVQNAMDGAKAEAQASVEAAASKMEAEAQVFLSKAQIYNNLADIAHQAATTEMDQEDIKSQFSAQLEELERINNEETSQQEMDNAFSIAENSADNATATGQNWIDAYKSAADASTAFAKTAASNNAAAEGKDPGAAVTYSGPTSVSGASNTGAQGSVSPRRAVETGTATREQYSQYEESARAQAQALTQNANNLIGMATELRARGNGVSNLTNNIGSGRGSSGRSGGGSSSSREVKELDNSLPDYYKQLEQALETVNNQLSLLQERQEHLSGKALIKNIEKQTAAYVKQAAVLERLNKTAAVDVATLRSQGSKYSNISYDTDGNITQESYEAEFAAQQAAYNAAVQRYNASAQTDADKAALKAAEESWQNFQDWIDNYDEAISKVEDYLNQLQEVIQSVADSNLSKFDVTFDVKLNTEELNREWAEFQRTYRRDFRRTERATAQDIRDLTESATSFQNSFNIEGNRFNDIINQADIMADVFSTYTDGLGNVSSDNVAELTEELRRQGVQYTTIADLQTDLQESFSSLQEYAEEVFNALQEGWDSYLQSLDDIDNKMNELLSTYDKLASKNEYYLRIAELTAGVYDRTTSAADQLTAAQRQYYETTINNSESNLRALKSQKETYQEILNAIVAKYKAEGKTQEEIEQMEDYQKAANMLESIQGRYQDTVISALEAAKALEEIQRQEAYTLLENALVGVDSEGNKYKDLAAEREAWEDALSYQERYYDTTQRLYQLDAIANKYTDAMNKDGISLKNQEKLNKMKQQELEILTKKEKLTKDDIALAEQRYNIAMAEIALEEARNNKNTMKVVRNEEGNWSYQYVADEENVADKEQALKDEYNELYELAKQAYQNSIQLALETKQEYLDKYKEIIEDEKLSEEEKQAAIALLNETYADRLKDYYDEAGQYMVDVNAASAQLITTIYQNELDGYSLMTEEQIGIAQAMEDAKLDSYYETRDLMAQGDNEYFGALQEYNSNSIAGWQDQAIQAQIANQAITTDSLTAYDMISDAAEQYRDTCDDVSDIVEEDWENLGEAMRDTEDDAQTAEDAVVDFGEEAQNQIRDQIEALQELQEIWNEVQSAIEQCRSALEQMMQAAESGIQSVTQAAASARSAASAATNTASSSGSGSRGGGGGSTGSSDKPYKIFISPNGASGLWGIWDTRSQRYVQISNNRQALINAYRGQISNLKSGGYTGEWMNGSKEDNGRLALLHQKELVLNEDDTANFLDAINTVRDLAHLSSSVNDVIMNSIAGLLYKMINSSPSNQVYNNNNTDNSVISPVFHINAEFPNATDKDSIMDAFISLPNIASQKVNMKLK